MTAKLWRVFFRFTGSPWMPIADYTLWPYLTGSERLWIVEMHVRGFDDYRLKPFFAGLKVRIK